MKMKRITEDLSFEEREAIQRLVRARVSAEGQLSGALQMIAAQRGLEGQWQLSEDCSHLYREVPDVPSDSQ